MPVDPDLNALSAYHYELPEELIAQSPYHPRDASRLMVIERASGKITEMIFRDLVDYLESGDSFVFNDTKVIPARLIGTRPFGGQAEVFLVERLSDGTWNAMVRPGKKLGVGVRVIFSDQFACEVVEVLPDGRRRMQFDYSGNFDVLLQKYGRMPLPPYIQQGDDADFDHAHYQTVFAEHAGAVAAPTAGLHFTQELLGRLADKGITQTKVTLHVGPGTFLPVQTQDIRQHPMHSEHFVITSQAAQQLNSRSPIHRQVCVGTTCCRALEAAMTTAGSFVPGEYETDIFIYPGYHFKYVQALLTNFHLPGSTLLMLVSAFAGYDLTMEAYAKAVEKRFRFYSYGDAMLIL